MKKLKLFVTTLLFLLALCIPTYAQTTSTRVAKNQTQLERLMSNKKVKIIQINTTKKTTITIPKGTYKKRIIVNSPKSTIVNNGKFVSITINNATKYIEKSKDNTIRIKDSKLKFGVTKNAIVNHLIKLKEKSDLQIICKGKIKKYTVKTTNPVEKSESYNIKDESNDNKTQMSDDSKTDNTETNSENDKDIDDIKEDNNTYTDIKDDNNTSTTYYPDYNWNYWTPTIVPPTQTVTQPTVVENNADDYSIEICSTMSAIQADSNETIYYEVKNNSTKLDVLPTEYRINTIATGCAITVSSFGAISIMSDSYADIAELCVELLDSDNTVIASKTISITIEPFSLSTLNNGYQLKFSYWDNIDSFTTYKGHNHYVWISSAEDENTQLERTDWQVAIINNNEKQNDGSLVWTDLSDSTYITGTLDEKYYSNAYKLNFAEDGKYYIRVKYNDSFVYSPIISVSDMRETYKFQDVEFDGQIYNVYITQSTRNVASFQIVDCAPEEVEELFSNITYIKYIMVGTQYRGLGVSYDHSSLGSYCMVYYNYDMEAAYNSQGQISNKRYYENNKLTVTEQYTNEILKIRTVITYDDQWREYTKITKYYDESGNITSQIGYYYTYDESGKRTTHNGFLE